MGAVDKVKGFISKKLAALYSLIPVLTNADLTSDLKELYALAVGIYVGVQGAIDLTKEIITHLKKGRNDA